MQPFHDDFDSRLAAVVSPLITDAVSEEDVRAGDLIQRHAAPIVGQAVAVVAVVALAAAVVAAPRLAGPGSPVQPASATPIDEASLAAVPHVPTADGIALVERTGDSIRLVLRRDNGNDIVLASLVEASPSAEVSYISGHMVDCPASTGLAQRYYNFGQANHVSSPKMTFDGITAVGEYRNGLYVAAITSDPTAKKWRTWLGPNQGTGGAPGSFATLRTDGAVSAAGCYYNAK